MKRSGLVGLVQCCQRVLSMTSRPFRAREISGRAQIYPPMSRITVLLELPAMLTAADPNSCTHLRDLPAALLSSILSHVPFQERLDVCALVCRSFHTAAVAATNSISTPSMGTQAQCDQLLEWLQRHGDGITSLEAQGSCQSVYTLCLASLPCPLLMDFDLYRLSLQPGFFSACTGLTRLLLKSCCVEDSPNAFSSAGRNPLTQLSVLSNLRHLGLATVESNGSVASPEGTFFELPSILLSQLVQLTYLQLGGGQVQSDAALQHLSALSALQHLDLNMDSWGLQELTPAALTGLQHLKHLTALRLCRVPWPINMHSMPAFTVLTALRVLQLSGRASIDPAVLAGFSQLHELDVRCRDAWGAEGSAALLAAIGQQSQLARLKLSPYRIWRPPSAAAFSAVTAISCLQHLELQNLELPVGAWQQMFPPGRCLPELHHLCLKAYDDPAQQLDLSRADLQAMVSCCPALDTLKLGRQLNVAAAAPLQQLTGLTSLSIRAPLQDVAPSIAQLTGMQELAVASSGYNSQVTVRGLLQLTVLQQLQFLSVIGTVCDPGLAISAAQPGVVFFNKAPAGAPPDVWLQLKERCEAAQQLQAG